MFNVCVVIKLSGLIKATLIDFKRFVERPSLRARFSGNIINYFNYYFLIDVLE